MGYQKRISLFLCSTTKMDRKDTTKMGNRIGVSCCISRNLNIMSANAVMKAEANADAENINNRATVLSDMTVHPLRMVVRAGIWSYRSVPSLRASLGRSALMDNIHIALYRSLHPECSHEDRKGFDGFICCC